MKISLTIAMVLLTCLLTSCGSSPESAASKQQTYVVKSEPVHKSLYFTGTIGPLHESAITCPMDAVIEKMNYNYGQAVKENEVVITLNSTELQKQYNDILTDYLKAKDNFTVAKAKFTGTEDLWKAGLIAKNNYLSEKSSLDTARIALMQSTRKLTEMLDKVDDNEVQHLSELNIAEFDKVKQALTKNHNLIHLKAPAQGILLSPPKSNEDKADHLKVGSSVKAGQVIALIGDLRGISVQIDVPEIDIDKIKPGMKAMITGVALGKEVLQGELVAVNAQASNAGNNGLPSFNATVSVRKLTPKQQALVKVGMSAAIELSLNENQQLVIPIAAIKQEKGASVVHVLNKGKVTTRQIATGPALADKVIIESGLQMGDTVVYDG
ncbi:Membrane-fusion protein [Legionella beliardensis]|uniref:Membrane-fusion protein n=1 Tax=Legionella beliardensis TaxID=91822 RepID=A0A378HXY0_9GAMM|nr:efflux RND transporter periplasmic adaptor subunit [Legionella beliardensis]STX27553.1 Membrane-fusion protein [Legionella beliardensis]